MILDYDHTYPNAVIRYYSSDMVLHVDSDADYIVFINVCSFTSGMFSLSNCTPNKPYKPIPKRKGPILNEVIEISIFSYAEKYETAGIFINVKLAVEIITSFIDLGNPQTTTPIKTDNSTSEVIFN